ncbi:MAG: protein translocase subunit SecF [Candidatus Peribacteria bacterium]|jgi:SecD/SecF fusion protein|nr:protein translocase subunit SecF [Candidatus Peribacteria bacterium]
MEKINIIKKSYVWIVSAIGIALVSLFLFVLNAHFSEEFTGGVNVTIVSNSSEKEIETTLKNYLDDQGYRSATVHINNQGGEMQIKINASLDSDEKVAELSRDVQSFLYSQKLISSTEDVIGQAIVGPSVGSYMKTTAVEAIIVGIILMVIYMLFAFSKIRKEIPAGVLASSVLAVLLFSVLGTLGAYGVWMMFNSTIQVDTVFIVAILTVVAYGINDVIVIFDRIRENIMKSSKDKNIVLGKVIETSLWQTMRRSIGTSLSTLLVLVAMFIFGTGVLQQFAFTVGCGVIISTFSSIFLG